MASLRILSGGNELFDVPVPEGAARERVAAAVELIAAGSPGPGRERLAALLKPLFPSRYRRSLFHISEPDALRLGTALLSPSPCPAPAAEISPDEKCPGTDRVPARSFPERPLPEKTAAADADEVEDEVIALAFAFKWTLEYAAALPPRLRARCLELCRFRRESPPPAGTAFAPEELARAVARNAAALARFRNRKKEEEVFTAGERKNPSGTRADK